MRITMNNHNDRAYEAMFDDLIQEVFGFSFAPWFARKLWDERYESYSIVENGLMLANVCIFKTDMLVRGRSVRAHQFGGVATRKSERGKGLARFLMEHILSIYPDTPAYLAANPSVVDFYPRFGFRRVRTYRPALTAQIDNPAESAIRLPVNHAIVSEALNRRGAHSDALDSLNTQPVQMFHLLLDYADDIYRLPGCGAIAVAARDGDTLFLADVVARTPVTFDALLSELPFSGIRRIEFGFCPDWLGITPAWKPDDMKENPFFVRGDWRLPEKFRFPVMSET